MPRRSPAARPVTHARVTRRAATDSSVPRAALERRRDAHPVHLGRLPVEGCASRHAWRSMTVTLPVSAIRWRRYAPIRQRPPGARATTAMPVPGPMCAMAWAVVSGRTLWAAPLPTSVMTPEFATVSPARAPIQMPPTGRPATTTTHAPWGMSASVGPASKATGSIARPTTPVSLAGATRSAGAIPSRRRRGRRATRTTTLARSVMPATETACACRARSGPAVRACGATLPMGPASRIQLRLEPLAPATETAVSVGSSAMRRGRVSGWSRSSATTGIPARMTPAIPPMARASTSRRPGEHARLAVTPLGPARQATAAWRSRALVTSPPIAAIRPTSARLRRLANRAGAFCRRRATARSSVS